MFKHTNPEQVSGLTFALQKLVKNENEIICDLTLTLLWLSIKFGELKILAE